MNDQYQKAKEYVFKLLTYRPRSKSEVRDRLKEKKYPEDVIDQVITMLEQYNYINDKDFAALWIQNRCRVKPVGRWRIKQELALKGIDGSIIEEQIQSHIDDEKEYQLGRNLIMKKRKFEGAGRQKIYNFLKRRGFSKETVNRIILEYAEEEPQNPYK